MICTHIIWTDNERMLSRRLLLLPSHVVAAAKTRPYTAVSDSLQSLLELLNLFNSDRCIMLQLLRTTAPRKVAITKAPDPRARAYQILQLMAPHC